MAVALLGQWGDLPDLSLGGFELVFQSMLEPMDAVSGFELTLEGVSYRHALRLVLRTVEALHCGLQGSS
jgi:hypothetical protein